MVGYWCNLFLEETNGAQPAKVEIEGNIACLEGPFFPFLLAAEMKYYNNKEYLDQHERHSLP